MSEFSVVFPGQGSQSVGMLSELAEVYPIVKDVFTEASDVLGYDLFKLVMEGPAEELNLTFRTQPALLASSYAIWKVWCSLTSKRPIFMAGHSLGEYSALVCAGSLDFKDAIKLVELRGKFMQEAVPAGVGSMAAVIGLDDDVVAQNCVQAAQNQVVSPVNYNSPGQVVIAGNKEAVERAGELLKAAGAKRVLPLSVSVPSHCILMKPAAERLEETLSNINVSAPTIPVINNVDVQIETDPNKIKNALVRQLFSPVKWTQSVIKMAENGVVTQLEMGPGKVLTGLVKRIDKRVEGVAVNTVATIQELVG